MADAAQLKHRFQPLHTIGSMTNTREWNRDPALAVGYAQDGYLVVADLLDDDTCVALKAEARAVVDGSPIGTSVCLGLSVSSLRFRALHADPRVIAVVGAALPDGIAFLSDKAVFKSASTRFATPWHIDTWYWPGTRAKVSLWIALDDARADNGCLTVVRGSHRHPWPQATRATGATGEGGATNGEFANLAAQRTWDPGDERVVTVRRGGAILFSDRLLHGSTANVAGADRWAAILTYHAPAPDEPFDRAFPARRTVVQRPQHRQAPSD